jgi:hypothetical protein
MKCYTEILSSIDTRPQKQSLVVDLSAVISEQIKKPKSFVNYGILKLDKLRINGVVSKQRKLIPSDEIKVTFGANKVTIPPIIEEKALTHFEIYLRRIFSELNISSIEELTMTSRPAFCSYLVSYFSKHSYESIRHQEIFAFESAFSVLEMYYKDSNKDVKGKLPKRKELLEIFLKGQNDAASELRPVITNLTNGIYDHTPYKFLQDYQKVINSPGFTQTIAPCLNPTVYTRASLEALIKCITEVRLIEELDQKFIYFESHKPVFSKYLEMLDNKNVFHKESYKPTGEYLFELFKKLSDASEVRTGNVTVLNSNRKYNFSNSERNVFDLILEVRNSGSGLARDIHLRPLNSSFSFTPFAVGILKPEESREISINSAITRTDFKPVLELECTWQDSAKEFNKSKCTIRFESQDSNIPWDELERSKPYSIQEIEEHDKLYGRDEILKELQNNILSAKIESYKIWGQKRVGKSSIVKTLKTLLSVHEKVIIVWRSVAGIKNTNPEITLNTLGQAICSEIFEEIDSKIKNESEKKELRSIQVPEFNGSLFPLETYMRNLKKVDSTLKFVIILDEFDRINEEFFLPGKLGDTLSLNIGKGLNQYKHIGMILVGSENMHLLDRQGINYNNYKEKEIDTFSREYEYQSFANIVTGPLQPFIKYSDESVERIFSVTNGNPYFANLICDHISKIIFKNRDNEVDVYTTNSAIEEIVNSSQKSHFEHFWGDGITEDSNIKKEKKADLRRRILITYSLYKFQNKLFPTRQDLITSFSRPKEYEIETFEIENTVKEFFNRKIFFEEGPTHKIRIKPALFENWLCGPSRTLMIEGVSDLEALHQEKMKEEEFSLKPAEISRIAELYRYKGEKQSIQDIEKYFRQFGGPFEQRRVFKLIDSLFYISKEEIIEFIKREQRNIFSKRVLDLKLGAKTPFREGVEICTFPATHEENTEIVESIKLITHIRKTKTLKKIGNRESWKPTEGEDIIIFESVVENYNSIADELMSFLSQPEIVEQKVIVKFIVLLITNKAKTDLIKATSSITNFKLIHFKEVQGNKIRPFSKSTDIFETQDELFYAYAEVRKQFPNAEKNSLNVLFESHCPLRSLDILWRKTPNFTPLFPNSFGQNIEDPVLEGEKRRDKVYFLNKKLSQMLNKFIVNNLKLQAQRDNEPNWLILKYVPRKVIDSVSKKWMDEGQKDPVESYFDFIDYKEIIKANKSMESTFMINDRILGNLQLKWIDTLNELRRDPAHVEKPYPTPEEVFMFETISDILLPRISH